MFPTGDGSPSGLDPGPASRGLPKNCPRRGGWTGLGRLAGQTHLKWGGTCRAATSSAAFSGATDSPGAPARRPPAARGLVLSQRDKTHLIWGNFDAFALGWMAGLALGLAGVAWAGEREPMVRTGPKETRELFAKAGVPLLRIEFVCELRASAGAVWFDADSLQLVKLP